MRKLIEERLVMQTQIASRKLRQVARIHALKLYNIPLNSQLRVNLKKIIKHYKLKVH